MTDHTARAQFPQARPRRLRRTENLRRMVRETRLSADGLIYPVFVVPGADVKEEIASMPGVYHQSIDRVAEAGHAPRRFASDAASRATLKRRSASALSSSTRAVAGRVHSDTSYFLSSPSHSPIAVFS